MHGAPLPILGTFHELGVAVDDVRVGVDFYERLGFTQATTTDAFDHPYGVMTDGRLFIGLHQRAGPSPVLTFVRRGVAQSVPELDTAGVELTLNHTGEEVFNEVGFEDPCGHAVAVLEARTYSPVDRDLTEPSACGDFAEVSLPAPDFAAAQAFWERLGFVAMEQAGSPYPHLTLTSDYLDIAFHQPRLCERPMLVFRDATMEARVARLREQGVSITARSRQFGDAAAFIESPDGTPLLLLTGED